MGRGRWLGGALVVMLALACGSKPKRATREDCLRVADHAADMLIAYFVSHPDELWDGVHANPGDTEIPSGVTKEAFPQFLASPEAKPWLAKRHDRALAGLRDEATMARCTGHQTMKWVACMMATTKPDDGAACDRQ